MNDERMNKLISLGPGVLTDALLKLADYDEKAERVIERRTSDPDDIVKKFRSRINGLKHRKRFIHRRESKQLAEELADLLDDLEAANPEPCLGMKLVATFIETDHVIYNNCDDSSGYISDVYRFGARNLFAEFASRCKNRKKILDLLIKIYSDDRFGTRDGLIDHAADFLGDEETKNAIHLFEILADEENDEYRKRHFELAIESLARQTGDAGLFEKIRLQHQPDPGISSCLEIARVYLENGDPDSALKWVERIPAEESYMSYQKTDLLQQIYGQLGDTGKQAEMAWINFRTFRSLTSLENLLEIIGEDTRERVIEDEAAFIIDDVKTDYSDIKFLTDVGKLDEAEICILAKAVTGTLEGQYYSTLLPFAHAMETDGRYLPASLIYRALLDSILERKYYKAYPYAARYLRKLDTLAENIEDWPEFLGDPVSTNAILDRIFHHSVIVKIYGPSYRKYQSDLLQKKYAQNKTDKESG